MPSFRNEPSEWRREDWRLLQNGYVHLFWSDVVLDLTVRWLTDDGYRVVTLDASEWATTEDVLVAIGELLLASGA